MNAEMSPEAVAVLSPAERRSRVLGLIEQARQAVLDARREYFTSHRLSAHVVLFSGGGDSTVLAHLMRTLGFADYAAHANTTIGIEQTRQFVRDTCEGWGIPLLERTAPVSYRDLVIAQGFPGPAMHYKMYQRLKERPLREIRRELVTTPRDTRVMFLAGRRRSESTRRAGIPLSERVGSTVWVSPLVDWTAPDMMAYRSLAAESGDPVPINPVSELLHMSGECLCGAFAQADELDWIGSWFPDVADEIEALEREVAAAGHRPAVCRWGHGGASRGVDFTQHRSGPLCTSCDARAASVKQEPS